MAYISAINASTRLSLRYELEIELLDVHVEMAEQSLSTLRPFIGYRYNLTQTNDFPRDLTLEGDTENVVPDAILDFIALRAASLAQADSMTSVSSKSISGALSKSYARPKITKLEAYLRNSIARLSKYQRQTGVY